MDKLGTPDADTPEELNIDDYQDVYDRLNLLHKNRNQMILHPKVMTP